MPIPTTKWRLSTLLNSNARSSRNKIDEMTELTENNKATLVRRGTKLIGEGGVIWWWE